MRDRSTENDGTLDERLYGMKDQLDPVAVCDAEGEVVERYAYTAFGLTTVLDPEFEPEVASSVTWQFLFHGEFRDEETDWYNYGYRYYGAELGRWLSRDPIGGEVQFNLYSFVDGNPLLRFDRFGLAWYDWVPVVGTIVHLSVTPKGSTVEDYTDATPDKSECNTDEDAAIENCKKSVRQEFYGYLSDWLGVTVASDALKSVASIAAGAIAQAGAKYGTRAAVAGTWTFGILAGDALVDAVTITVKAVRIKDVAEEAFKKYCVCCE